MNRFFKHESMICGMKMKCDTIEHRKLKYKLEENTHSFRQCITTNKESFEVLSFASHHDFYDNKARKKFTAPFTGKVKISFTLELNGFQELGFPLVQLSPKITVNLLPNCKRCYCPLEIIVDQEREIWHEDERSYMVQLSLQKSLLIS